MTVYKYSVALQGATNDDKTRRTFNLGDLADEPAALLAEGALHTALAAVTLANFKSETIVSVISEDNQLPVAGDTYEEAVVMCHLNAPTEAEKLVAVRIPAPEGLFLADGETVDLSNADLVAFIDALATHVYLSDGEQINTATGTNGMKEGWKATRSKRFN